MYFFVPQLFARTSGISHRATPSRPSQEPETRKEPGWSVQSLRLLTCSFGPGASHRNPGAGGVLSRKDGADLDVMANFSLFEKYRVSGIALLAPQE
jgi:hypothetical protein